MVEQFNRSLLQLLRAYVDTQSEWKHYLPLVLYAYRTSTHSSTGVSPFLLMYGCNSSSAPFSKSNKFDSLSYPAHLQVKLAELRGFVEANLTEAAHTRNVHMIIAHQYAPFLLGNLFGSLLPLLENSNPGPASFQLLVIRNAKATTELGGSGGCFSENFGIFELHWSILRLL